MTTEKRRDSVTPAVAGVLGAVISTQLGASFAKVLFEHVPPTTAVWLRLFFASLFLIVLWVLRRRRLGLGPERPWRDHSRRVQLIGLGYAVALVGMNWSFYEGIRRLPLGLAVTIEFLGPLTVAVIGSRRRLDLVWVGLAAAGIALLGLRPQALDLVGVLFILIAATCWGSYIMLASRARQHWDGGNIVTAACTAGAFALCIPALLLGGKATLDPHVLGMGMVLGLLCSAIPYTLEMVALGSIPPAVLAILESLSPAVAALAAWVLLGETLGLFDWVAIGCVVAASTGSTLSQTRRHHLGVEADTVAR